MDIDVQIVLSSSLLASTASFAQNRAFGERDMGMGIAKKVGVIAAASLCVLGAGSSAWAASTSTKLSNGTLYSTVENGRIVSGNSSLFYSTVKYSKSGGSTVSAILVMDSGSTVYSSAASNVAAGASKSYSFGGKPVPSGCRDRRHDRVGSGLLLDSESQPLLIRHGTPASGPFLSWGRKPCTENKEFH
ncbi:hypothetical protein ACNPQM_43910 [Streptomyces sp. NPDC056231]|uniref:hypothetical protein n=1 Tax=Streptomyces sp. NPDC056231 TaxID=3345755 RepID=UPI003AB075DC